MTGRPNVSASGPIEVFEAHRVLAWHDEKMAGCDGVQVHEDNNSLILVHDTGLGLSRRDGAEDAPLRLTFQGRGPHIPAQHPSQHGSES